MFYTNEHDFWALGVLSIWKWPRKYARKCHGFPRVCLAFLTHNMARPPKDILATEFCVSPKKNQRKNRSRHIIWRNPLLQSCRQRGSHPPFSATYHGARPMAATPEQKG